MDKCEKCGFLECRCPDNVIDGTKYECDCDDCLKERLLKLLDKYEYVNGDGANLRNDIKQLLEDV